MVSVNVGPTSEAPDISDLTDLEIVEAMVEWFLENFEDPAEITPYESAEGGYQWIWGGPYDAREELEDAFGMVVSENLIQQAVNKIQRHGLYDWAPHQNRLVPEEELDDFGHQQSPYEEMLSAVEDVAQVLNQLPSPRPQLGHNRPPEDIGLPPYTPEDDREVRQAIELLKAQEEEPKEDTSKLRTTAVLFNQTAEKLLSYLAQKADKAVDSFSTEIGKRSAQAVAALGIWQLFAEALQKASAAVMRWLDSVVTFF